MGCLSSKPVVEGAFDTAAKPFSPPQRQQRPTPPSIIADTAKPAASVAATSYDTQSAASLVTPNGVAPVAFYGILTNNSNRKLTLANRASAATEDHVVRSVHRSDDSTTGIAQENGDKMRGKCAADAGNYPVSCPSSSITCDGVTVVRGTAMNMPYSVLVAGEIAQNVLSRVCDQIEAVFAKANATVNTWNPQSDVSQLNETTPGKSIIVSPDLAALFDIVDELCELTEGRFDPTACIINLAWASFMSEHGRAPMPADLSHLRFAIGWKTKIKRKSRTCVSRSNGNTIVDTDGVAKGFVVDLLFDALFGMLAVIGGPGSQPSLYVDWAGDIRACGMHPSGRPWRTAVMKPPPLPHVFQCWADGNLATCLSESDVTQFVDLDADNSGSHYMLGKSGGGAPNSGGVAIATSGDYYQIKKFGYHHIVNPGAMAVMKAGSRTVGSVSVMAASCALADGLATAAMTSETAGEAAQLLKRIIARAPETVFGYCVVGRGIDKESDILISPYFKDASADLSTSRSNSMTPTTPEHHPSLDQAECNAVVDRSARITCTLAGLDGIPVAIVDSLSSLSLMNAEPYVSFLLSAEYANVHPCEGQKFSLTLPTMDCKGERTSSEPKLIIRVVQTIQVRSAEGVNLIVVAAVSEAIMGSCKTICLTYMGKHRAVPISEWPTENYLTSASVLARTKELLRRMPTGMWLITADGADGAKCGLTASSIATSAASPNILTFNLLRTSAFYASFCGVGTLVRTFLLNMTQTNISDKYVQTHQVSTDDMKELDRRAMLSLDVIVEDVSHVLDHLLVVCKVQKVVSGPSDYEDCQSPLLRVDRSYTELSHVDSQALLRSKDARGV
jgi:FAD:protein FMN transferase